MIYKLKFSLFIFLSLIAASSLPRLIYVMLNRLIDLIALTNYKAGLYLSGLSYLFWVLISLPTSILVLTMIKKKFPRESALLSIIGVTALASTLLIYSIESIPFNIGHD
jgi:hypothetical protein